MKIFVGKIGCGKTVALIRECVVYNGTYVCSHLKYKGLVEEMALAIGDTLKKIISFDEYLNLSEEEKKADRFFFDIDELFKDNDAIALSTNKPLTKLLRKEEVSLSFLSQEIPLDR